MAHTADDRFAAGSAYDPTPGLRASAQYNDKFYSVDQHAGRVMGFIMRLPARTGRQVALQQARAMLPPDAQVVWESVSDACYMVQFTSRRLAGIGIPHGGVLIMLGTDGAGQDTYSPSNVNEAVFVQDYSATAADSPGC
jgi:hypothetical protein